MGVALFAITGAVFIAPGNRAAIAQGYGITLQQLAARLTVVESKTQFMTASANTKTTTFSGCNVYIQNGLGATNGNPNDPTNTSATVTNGLGNLVIGYNLAGRIMIDPVTGQPLPNDVRTGSHNLILGDQNNYSSYGGIVAGDFNSTSAAYATVSGGSGNYASGIYSTVSGGIGNSAGGAYATVSGGSNSVATGTYSTVSGGVNNTASGIYSVVSGGINNNASDTASTVSGGSSVTQGNPIGWSGGSFHTP
jgi:hypothetical protein